MRPVGNPDWVGEEASDQRAHMLVLHRVGVSSFPRVSSCTPFAEKCKTELGECRNFNLSWISSYCEHHVHGKDCPVSKSAGLRAACVPQCVHLHRANGGLSGSRGPEGMVILPGDLSRRKRRSHQVE